MKNEKFANALQLQSNTLCYFVFKLSATLWLSI